MVIDEGNILCHKSKQAAGNTENLYTAKIDNKLTKYTASKNVFDKYEVTHWANDHESIERAGGILFRP